MISMRIATKGRFGKNLSQPPKKMLPGESSDKRVAPTATQSLQLDDSLAPFQFAKDRQRRFEKLFGLCAFRQEPNSAKSGRDSRNLRIVRATAIFGQNVDIVDENVSARPAECFFNLAKRKLWKESDCRR